MNLSDITSSDYLASDDYKVETLFPPREITRIEMKEIGVAGKSTKQAKCVIYLKDVPKGWVINKQDAPSRPAYTKRSSARWPHRDPNSAKRTRTARAVVWHLRGVCPRN